MSSRLLEAAHGQLRLLQGVAGLQVHGGLPRGCAVHLQPGTEEDSKDQDPG
jgi:hypothetical protein